MAEGKKRKGGRKEAGDRERKRKVRKSYIKIPRVIQSVLGTRK